MKLFFKPLLVIRRLLKKVNGYLTYTDWSVDPGPAFISAAHLPVLKDADKFFARKFSDHSGDIVSIIDATLRLEKNG